MSSLWRYLKSLAETPMPLEDIELIVWHRLLIDSHISTYVMVNGREVRHYVNPDLALIRLMAEMDGHFKEMAEHILKTMLPSFENVAEVMANFAKNFEQLGLIPLFQDGDTVN